jgi:hypothetical protein
MLCPVSLKTEIDQELCRLVALCKSVEAQHQRAKEEVLLLEGRIAALKGMLSSLLGWARLAAPELANKWPPRVG